MKTYKLTSPLESGNEVKTIQRRLAGNNHFKENYRPGKIDGVFGETTAAAAYRAKYALGYLAKDLTRTYGPTLDQILTGDNKLPKPYQTRRTNRKKKAKAAAAGKTIGQKALAEAAKHIGVKESPTNSNRCQFSVWYGIIGPWCAMFATYSYVVGANSKAFARGRKFSYVPYIVSAARSGGQGMFITRTPKAGDLVCFDWNGDGIADHVELFDHWNPNGTFAAIGGNTGPDNVSNGGMVMRSTRYRNQVQCFIRVVK